MYRQWMDLFGRPADDVDVRKALAEAGTTKPPKIADDELSVSVKTQHNGMSVGFTDDSILNPEGGLLNRPILSSVLMILQHPMKAKIYEGPLPFGLKKEMSQSALQAAFGAPKTSSKEYGWDSWLVDGWKVTVTYSPDFKSINRVAVSLPNSR